ncbi:protein FAM174C-like [Gracilinanus agilis]|uniref:protein FAM174C-like n=1 Tax=Gracilinanus agilis TaxID=191870 RepID=UPI001CFF38F0|nr:protein FAM174C-like [Gracilinanus agilis]
MVPRHLLPGLLFKAWALVWVSGLPLPQDCTVLAANGSSEAGAGVLISAYKALLPFNISGRRRFLPHNMSLTVQLSLFLLSGFCSLVALYFMSRTFKLKARMMKKKPPLPASEGLQELAFSDSDEETISEILRYK